MRAYSDRQVSTLGHFCHPACVLGARVIAVGLNTNTAALKQGRTGVRVWVPLLDACGERFVSLCMDISPQAKKKLRRVP